MYVRLTWGCPCRRTVVMLASQTRSESATSRRDQFDSPEQLDRML
jgi:hypothetical protein